LPVLDAAGLVDDGAGVATRCESTDGTSASMGSAEAPTSMSEDAEVAPPGVLWFGVNFGLGRLLERCARSATCSTAPLPPHAETTIAAPSERPSPDSTLRRLSFENGSPLGDAGSGGRRSGSCGVRGGTVSHDTSGVGPTRRSPLVDTPGGPHGARSLIDWVMSSSALVATLLFTTPPSLDRSDRSWQT
jgi:hypothetical protein